jgi:uncharacterized protein
MKLFLIAALCLACSAPALAQNADEPASKDDVILYLRTMHSHDLLRKTMEVQSQTMQKLLYEQAMKEKGSVPADFETHMKKAMDHLVKDFPADQVAEAMIPAYQKHFTHGDIAAITTFYASPVGQKVLHELPAVMQEGMEAAMPLMSKYLSDWQEQLQKEVKDLEDEKPSGKASTPASQN